MATAAAQRGPDSSMVHVPFFWAVNYPALQVGELSEDICNSCYEYCNQLKFNGKGKGNNDEESDDDEVNEQEALTAADSKVDTERRVQVNDDPTISV